MLAFSNVRCPAFRNSSGGCLILHLRLHPLDLLFDVAVGREDVGEAVEVVVEEEHAKGQRQQAGATDRGARRLVHEQILPLVVIEAQHLVREVADDQVRTARAIVVGGIDTHRAARHAVLAVGDPRRTCLPR